MLDELLWGFTLRILIYLSYCAYKKKAVNATIPWKLSILLLVGYPFFPSVGFTFFNLIGIALIDLAAPLLRVRKEAILKEEKKKEKETIVNESNAKAMHDMLVEIRTKDLMEKN